MPPPLIASIKDLVELWVFEAPLIAQRLINKSYAPARASVRECVNACGIQERYQSGAGARLGKDSRWTEMYLWLRLPSASRCLPPAPDLEAFRLAFAFNLARLMRKLSCWSETSLPGLVVREAVPGDGGEPEVSNAVSRVSPANGAHADWYTSLACGRGCPGGGLARPAAASGLAWRDMEHVASRPRPLTAAVLRGLPAAAGTQPPPLRMT